MDKLQGIEPCVDCLNGKLVLGKSTHKEIGMMFYTISPDPELVGYGDRLPESQKKWINKKFIIAYIELQKHLPTMGYTIHYEFNKSMNLHLHGLIYIDGDYEFYDKNLATASKVFHKHFGRQYGKSIIDSRFEWINDLQQVLKYVNKSNEYPPIHHIRERKQLTQFLSSERANNCD